MKLAFHPSVPFLPTPPRPSSTISPPRPRMHLALTNPDVQTALKAWGLQINPDNSHPGHISALNPSPPIIRIQNFLTSSQCLDIINLQRERTIESDLYLNYRVNKQVSQSGSSSEASNLIAQFESAVDTLDATMPSGFRSPVDSHAAQLKPVLNRLETLLAWSERRFVFQEGAWVRPSKRSVVVRDVTTVHYGVGEGVAPHVDGKDLTVLLCLQQPEEGGRTVFPEDGLSVPPKVGTAILYQSQKELLHFAERVAKGEKWVLQMLVDFRVRADERDVDYQTGNVFS